jgi:solute carrier family 35 protein C2
MCKSSTLIFVLMFAFLFRLEKFSYRLVGVILLITSGVVLMVATETKFVLTGMILVLTASVLAGLRWALTQVLLSKHEMGMDNPCATIYWLSPTMGIILLSVAAAVEGLGAVFTSQFFHGFWNCLTTLFFLITPGSVAFFMVLSEY